MASSNYVVTAFSGPASSSSATMSHVSDSASSGDARRAIRVAQAKEDAKLHSAFEKAASGDGAFDYSQSIGASRGITLPSTGCPAGTDPAAGVSVTAYLQKMQRGGLIQSFGCMLVVEESTFNVLAYSENAAEMMGFLEKPDEPTPEADVTTADINGEQKARPEAPPPVAESKRDPSVGKVLRSLSSRIKRALGAPVPENTEAGPHKEAGSRKRWGRLFRGSKKGASCVGEPLVPPEASPDKADKNSTDKPADVAKPAVAPKPKGPMPKIDFGVSALSLFSKESCFSLKKLTHMNDVSMMNPLMVRSAVADRPFYAIFHRTSDGLHVDLEPIRAEDQDAFGGEGAMQAHRLAAKAIARLERVPAGNVQLLCETVVQEVRALTGYDRIMAYKFHEDEHGEVLAEARKESMEPYLGLHYPATDIPQAARFLFLKNRVRIIVNCRAPNVSVLQDVKLLKDPVVLSNSTLRSVHGCHAQYMENMGTLGSIGMAIVANDPDAKEKEGDKGKKLWGLVVCHHEEPRYLAYPLRLACEFLMQVFSLKINLSAEMMAQEKEKQMLRTQTLLCDMLQRDAVVGIVTQYPNITDLVKCDGAALLYGGRFWTVGMVPTEIQMMEIVDWLQREHGDSSGFSTDSLKDSGYPHAEALGDSVCGMIAAQLLGGDYLFWFRSHVEKEVVWHGAKHQPGEKDDGNKMHPRASFQAFLEVVKNRSQPWDDLEIDAVSSLVLILRGHLTSFNANDFRNMEAARLAEKDVERMSIAESELSRILETATAPVFTVDKSGCITAWNAKMVHLTGLSTGEALGKSLVHDLVQDTCRNAVGWALSLALKGEEAKQIEMRIKKFNPKPPKTRSGTPSASPCPSTPGSHQPNRPRVVGEVLLVVNAFVSRGGLLEEEEEEGEENLDSAEGGVSGVCFVGQDVTQQKIVEGHFTKVQGDYAAIVHSGNSLIPPIFAIDEGGMCAEWNPAMEELSGVSRGQALGQVLMGFLFGATLRMKSDARTKLMIVLNQGVSGQNTERYPLAFLNRKGELVEALLTVNARRDAAGQVMGAFCFLHTASPELQAAIKLQRAAQEIAEAKAMAVAYVRQEIKGPLDAFKYVRTKLVEAENLGDDARRVLETSVRCEQQITRVLDDDNIENLEEGFLGLESDEYRLENVLEAVVAMARQSCTNKSISFDCECSEDLSRRPPLAGDALRLQQALSGLVGAAVQFTPEGGWVTVKAVTGSRSAFFADPNSLRCEFRVTHSGCDGLPPAMIKQMYDACSDKSELTQEGLSLSVSRKIVLAMEGDVQYDRVFDHCEFVVRMALSYPREPSSCATPVRCFGHENTQVEICA